MPPSISKPTPPKAVPTSKATPTEPLPTRRMAFNKQVEILRAYPAICSPVAKAVTNAEIASVVELAPDTVGMANPFFVAIGLLDRSERGCTPCSELMAFYHAHQWDPDAALHKLAPVFERAWFGQVLMPKLRFRDHSEEEALTALAEASAAIPDYRPQLKMVLDYLEIVGTIVQEDGRVRLARNGASPGAEQLPPLSKSSPKENAESNGAAERRTGGQVSTAFSREGQGALDLNINIHVDMNEMAKWSPDRITAFLSGLAQVLAAKGEIEKGETQQ